MSSSTLVAPYTLRSDFQRFAHQYGNLVRGIERSIAIPELPLVEARAVLELASRSQRSCDLARCLSLDSGQASRTVASLERKGVIIRAQAASSTRGRPLLLTPKGHRMASEVATRQNEAVAKVLEGMSPVERNRLFRACDDLSASLRQGGDFLACEIRPIRPMEIGQLIHGAVTSYCQRDPHFNGTFEPFVCSKFAVFSSVHDPRQNHGLAAEHHGRLAGSILVSRDPNGTATVQLLSVHVGHQGRGIGSRLVREATRWAADHGCSRVSARIRKSDYGPTFYAKHDWSLAKAEPVTRFGHRFVAETWVKRLKNNREAI